MSEVIKIPISYSERKKNEMGKGYVPCQISTRYLRVKGIDVVGDEDWISLDVMTENDNHEHKKICEMIISKEDLYTAIKEIEEKEF